MGTQVQQRPRLLPDVRLDISESGIRVDFDVHDLGITGARPGPFAGARIHRRDRADNPDLLTSDNLIALAELTGEVEARRADIRAAMATCRQRTGWAGLLLRISRGVAVFAPSFTGPRVAALETAREDLKKTEADLTALLDAMVLNLDFSADEEQRAAYLKLVDAFRGIARAPGIWQFPPDRTAARALGLKPARFAVEPLPVFRSAWPAMRFEGIGRAELFLMPGFIALRQPGMGLALIDMRDLEITFSPRKASEVKRSRGVVRVKPVLNWLDEDRPEDGPDAEAQYGDIEIASATDRFARFMVSDWRALRAFRHALRAFRESVSRRKEQAAGESASVPYAQIPDLKLPALPALPWQLPWGAPLMVDPARAVRMAAAAVVVCCLFVGAGLAVRYSEPSPPVPVAETAPSAPSPETSAPPAPAQAAAASALPSSPSLPSPAPDLAASTHSPGATDDNPPAPPPAAAAPTPVAETPPVDAAKPVPTPAPPAVMAVDTAQEQPTAEASTPASAASSAEAVLAAMPSIVTAAGPAAPASPAPAAAPSVVADADVAQEQPVPPAAAPVPAARAIPNPVLTTPDEKFAKLVASLAAAAPEPTAPVSAPPEPALAKPAPSSKQEVATAAKPPSPGAQALTLAEVTDLQTQLSDLGYYYGSPDGQLDGLTVEAFNAWRSETGRRATRTIARADYYAFLAAIAR